MFVEQLRVLINKTLVGVDQILKNPVKILSLVLYSQLAHFFSEPPSKTIDVYKKWLKSIEIHLHNLEKLLTSRWLPRYHAWFARLFSGLLNGRLSNFLDSLLLLADNQQGARPSRRASDKVFILQQIREDDQKLSSQCIVVLNLSKAFDRGNRTFFV